MFSKALGKYARGNILYCCGTDTERIAGEMFKIFCYDNEGRETTVLDAIDYLSETDVTHIAIEGYPHIYRIRVMRLLVEMFRGLEFSRGFSDERVRDCGLILAGRYGETSAYLLRFQRV